jgi:mannose-6-phosphate isomerase
MKVYPIRFKPIYRNYFWGGDRIIKKYHRNSPPGRYAESWEICDRYEKSIVENGSYKGLSISALLFEWQEKLTGKDQFFDKFPLLIKIIDSKQNLSIQVHPDENSAENLASEAKNEAWYVLESNNTNVYAGFKHQVNEVVFKEAIEKKRLPEILRKIKVKKNDVINIPGGRVHAICEGGLFFEVQQNSDTTYRIYDWDRLDDNGNLRPLHLIQAFQTINFKDEDNPLVSSNIIYQDKNYSYLSLLKTKHFIIEKIIIYSKWIFDSDQTSFQIYFCLNGSAKIIADNSIEQLNAGQTYLIPAHAKETKIINESKVCEVLKITLP